MLVVEESVEDLALVATDEKEALVDCACPNSVSGKKWIEDFCSDLDADDKLKVSISES